MAFLYYSCLLRIFFVTTKTSSAFRPTKVIRTDRTEESFSTRFRKTKIVNWQNLSSLKHVPFSPPLWGDMSADEHNCNIKHVLRDDDPYYLFKSSQTYQMQVKQCVVKEKHQKKKKNLKVKNEIYYSNLTFLCIRISNVILMPFFQWMVFFDCLYWKYCYSQQIPTIAPQD